MQTTKINTEQAYKITDILLNTGYKYNNVSVGVCEYINNDKQIKFIKYKVIHKRMNTYKFVKVDMETQAETIYDKKTQVRPLIKELEGSLNNPPN